VVPTYCNDTVVRVPAAATLDEDRGLLCTTGRALAESYLRERCPSGSRHDREPVGVEERRFRWRWSAADELGTHPGPWRQRRRTSRRARPFVNNRLPSPHSRDLARRRTRPI